MRYIAFLRAVNVGKRQVTMARLRELFSELGYGDVRTYIQTGNVFFETPATDRAALEGAIERHLLDALGFAVPTFVRTVEEVEAALASDPFAGIAVTPDTRLCCLFTSAPLPADLALPVVVEQRDSTLTIVAASPDAVFVVIRQVPGKAGNAIAFIEKTYKVRATARFFDTTKKIVAAARGGA
jgi:uncharacterized protein (DUF1697 family)